MKYLLPALCLLTACHSQVPVNQTTVTSGPTKVTYRREFKTTLHADTSFDPAHRVLIREAAGKWNRASEGYISIDVDFDLDFDSISGLHDHINAHHDTVISSPADTSTVESIDGEHPGVLVLAAAPTMRDGSRQIILIMSRIEPSHFEAVVTHEIGHVIGLPDSPTYGSIMSAVEVRGHAVPSELTDEDLALCRGFHFCR